MAGTRECMLTTEDNPFNPFVDFDRWLAYDMQKGYNTCGYLARIALTSPEFSDEDQQDANEAAIDEILSFNVLGNYCKIFKDGKKETSPRVAQKINTPGGA